MCTEIPSSTYECGNANCTEWQIIARPAWDDETCYKCGSHYLIKIMQTDKQKERLLNKIFGLHSHFKH